MRVLLLNRSYYPSVGGIENSLYYLSRELQKQGHEVMILTQELKREYPERKEYAAVMKYSLERYHKLAYPVIPLLAEKRVAKFIEANRTALEADIVICRDALLGKAYLRTFPQAHFVYIPAVITKYYNKGIRPSSNFREFAVEVIRYFQQTCEAWLQKQTMRSAEKIIVFSNNVKNQIIMGKLCDPDKVTVCYPGVSDRMLGYGTDALKNSSPNFIFVGRLVAEKNIHMLLKAFSMVQEENKQLTIVGDGAQKDILQKTAGELSLENNVHFVGKTTEPEKYYRQADFFVIPSTYESFGQVISEALMSGLPVIGFKTIKGKTLTAIDELVRDDETGFICGEFSENALCECLEKAVSCFHDADRYAKMKKDCRRFAEEHFSWTLLVKACIMS